MAKDGIISPLLIFPLPITHYQLPIPFLIVTPIAIDLCYRSHSSIFFQPRIPILFQDCPAGTIGRLAAFTSPTST